MSVSDQSGIAWGCNDARRKRPLTRGVASRLGFVHLPRVVKDRDGDSPDFDLKYMHRDTYRHNLIVNCRDEDAA